MRKWPVAITRLSDWPRPIRLAAAWVPIAALLAAINLVFIVGGGFIWADKYGYGWDKTWIGLGVLAVGLLLYIYRRVVEDKTGVPLREETPTMPPPEQPAAAPAAV